MGKSRNPGANLRTMFKAALLLNRVNLKRYWRILGQLGLFRSVFLLALLLGILAYTSQPQLFILQSLLVVFTLAGVHWGRNDKTLLLNLGVKHPLFFLSQYGMFMLPFALFYLSLFSFIPFLILLSGWLLISFLKKPLKNTIFSTFKVRFSLLPAQCWEWRAGLKQNWWIMAGLLTISMIFYDQIIVLMVAMVLISLLVADFQSNHEQTLMIQALQLKIHKFLGMKIFWQTLWFTVAVLPIIILFLFQFQDSYMVLVMAYSASLMVQICAVLFKYMAFEQGEKTSLFMGILALLNISFLLPPILPVPLILIPVLYKKATNRLITLHLC